MTPTLTVGIAVYRDSDSIYFTLESLHAHHSCVQYLVIDNAPESDTNTRDVTRAIGGRYLHRPDLHGTSAPRDALFRLADTEWVLCVDSHVLLEPGAVQALLDYIDAHPDSNDLVQGPMIHDDGRGMSTHWRPAEPVGLWGTWDSDPRGIAAPPPDLWAVLRRISGDESLRYDEERWAALMEAIPILPPPFDIPMQGLGLFAMRRAAWPGFHPLFRGFGGEEGYLHEKVRQRGGKCWCLPALRWRHKFRNMERGAPPPPYRLAKEDHVWNLLVGHRELGIDAVEAIGQTFGGLPPGMFEQLAANAEKAQPFGQHAQRKRLKLLGVWYSNNAAPEKLLKASLDTIERARRETMFHDVLVTTCSWEPIAGNPFPARFHRPSSKGHAAIVEQILVCEAMARPYSRPTKFWGPTPIPPLYRSGKDFDYDAIVFLEHDVLYPPDYFDRMGNALATGAPVVSNLDYEGLNATGWLRVKERHEPMHQLALRRDVALANLQRAERECEQQGWAYLEPDSAPVVVRESREGLLGVDFDGTLSLGWNPPSRDFVVITGRGNEQSAEVVQLVGERPVYYRPSHLPNNTEGVARHKAETIKRLGVVEYWEDDARIAEILRRECPNVLVHLVKGPPPEPNRNNWVRLPPVGLAPSIHVNW